MSLQHNLKAAKLAVQYVKSLGLLASNKVGDRLQAAGGIENVVGRGTDNTAEVGVGITRFLGPSLGPLGPGGYCRGIANTAIQTKSGNCGEQAIIALIYLKDLGIRPLDLMVFSNTPAYDHQWVVIGLDKNWDNENATKGHNLRTWGAEAVWCDPWQGNGVAFAVDDLVKGKVRNLNAIYKCNTAELVADGEPESILRYN